MSFIRTRTIKGRQYRYLEIRWREGRKVKSKSTFLGAVGAVAGFIGTNLRSEGKSWEITAADLAKDNETISRDEAARQAHMDNLHEKYGLTVGPLEPVPVEKERPALADLITAPVSQPSSETAQHSPESNGTAPAASPR